MVPPHFKKSPDFPSSSREEYPFQCFVGKGIPAFPSHLKRRRSQINTREELQCSCHLYKRPRFPNALQIHLTPLKLPRRTPFGMTQNTMAGVTALWHLERKPPIPMSTRQEACHCFSSWRGDRLCMSLYETMSDSPVETPEEPRDTSRLGR